MTKLWKERIKKIGMPPGTLKYIGAFPDGKITISIYDYDKDNIIEKRHATLEECLIMMNTPSVTWINVLGVHDTVMVDTIGRHFGLHPLLLEDIVTTTQLSKVDDYKEHLFIVMRMLKYQENKEQIVDEQISIILGKSYLISFVESENDIFDSIRARLQKPNSRIRAMGPDYLCYALIDSIVDHYFLILEKMDNQLELLEDSLLDHPTGDTLKKIQKCKREIILLRKAVWPTRESIHQLRRMESPLICDNTKLYLHDVYDHTIQAIDTIESFRDLTSGLLDIYLSNMSHRLSEVMKVLTIVATIFVPLTFITSMYGMNFEYMPELKMKWGYPAVLVFMITIAAFMLYYFRKKKWI